MPQLNVLPINVSQNIELKNESASANSTTSNDDFSQYIDLHLTKNKEVENINDVDGVNSKAKKNSSVTDTELDTKKPEDLADNANTSTNINDESEQLMLFLTKADNTLINQSADFSSVRPSSEKLSVEQKAYDETKLLLKASALVADLSKVAKAISKETLVLGDVAKATDKDSAESTVVKSSVESLNDGKNKDMTPAAASADGIKLSVKKTILSEADVESKTDVKQTNISSDKTNTAPKKPSQPLSAEPLVDNDVVSKNDESASLTAEQTKVEQTQKYNNKIAQDTLPKEINQAAVDIKKTVTSNNQLAASADDANKIQAKQDEKVQLAASFAEQNQQKAAVQKEEELLVVDKVIASVKREPFANSHFIDVSGKATQTPQQIIDQQSVEILNPSVATEVTQSQKTNTQLHQEAISLFRKDSAEAVKDKVMLMISQKLQQFDITLDPPELGNIQVRVNLQGEQAVVNFMVQSQQTKDALEQNMHKLKELLAEQGVDVGDANVEQQSQQSANEEDSAAGNNNQMAGEIDNMTEANDVVAHTLSAKVIDSSTASVDYYA
ncbi:MAG: flagellar hook-length control protein FliK [Colwellia sp.]|nr:flagellar hook-length control protein FliK [Colwellia sp.]